jgi:flagellar FliJ protein
MAKYKFRLATLQKLREARRDRERSALAEAYRADQVLADRRAELSAEEVELRALQRSAAAAKYLNVNRLLEAQRYELVLKARGAEIARHQAALAVETERRRQQLIEADREVRVLERLHERKLQEHRRVELRDEIKELDEVASRRLDAGGNTITCHD